MPIKIAGWRKFIVVMTALVGSFVLAVTGRLTGEFVSIVSAVVGAFVVGNAAEHLRKPGEKVGL